MAAATADREPAYKPGDLVSYKMKASTTIYKGTLVAVDPTTGLAQPFVDAANNSFVGVASEKKTSAATGTTRIRVLKRGTFEMGYNGGDATDALIPDEVYGKDDTSVDEDAVITTADVKVGRIVEVLSTTKVRIRIDNHVN